MKPPFIPQSPIPRDRVVALLKRMRESTVIVLGDLILDRYLIGDAERLSPEAPVPVLKVTERRGTLGGAANVAANVGAIGATCHLVGVVGDDADGRTLRQELVMQRLSDRYIMEVAGRTTTSKTRVLVRNQQIVRIDEEVETHLDTEQQERLTSMLDKVLAGADALLVEDYNKGVLSPDVIATALNTARHQGVPVVVDPKFRHFFSYAGATVFKPNRRELEAALGAAVDLDHREALPAAIDRLGVDNLLLTLGSDGMILVTRDGSITHIPSIARAVYDVSGAGDTVTAWVGTALAAGASVREAAQLATHAAGVEVGKAGVATVTPDEVAASHEAMFDRIGMLRRKGLI
jgi:D-beta-D-heptose 7-phosphate kinase/D-beta-D-heptose 1-phosphate adenosyltransferase